jgi:peptidoglycan hydrolase CwlO-like protein
MAAALGFLLFGGCVQESYRAADGAFPEQPRPPEAVYLQKAVVARESDAPLPTAVENAIVLQDKYARALEDLRREQEQNRALSDENRKLTEAANRLQAETTKTQQELTEANALLIQMRQEIEKWKADVLGYRDEMRKANQAQIEALGKVLALLGAEADSPAAGAPATPTAAAPATPRATATTAAAPPAVKPGVDTPRTVAKATSTVRSVSKGSSE